MTAHIQPELPVRTDTPLFEIREDHPNVEWLVALLAGRDWTPCEEVLKAAGKTLTEHHRRWVRRLAQRSKGRVIGQPGQSGYKLTTACTAGEYQHWRNTMKSQADEMCSRIISADKVFYGRAQVSIAHGILDSAGARPSWPLDHPAPDYAI